MKFYPLCSKGMGEMALDRRTEGWTEGRTDEAVTIACFSGSMINNIAIAKNKLDISKNCNFTRNPAPFFSMTEHQIGKRMDKNVVGCIAV